MHKGKFVVTKIRDVGGDHAICKRMFLQFTEIIDKDFTKLTKENIEKVKEQLWYCMHDLLDCEELVKKVIQLYNNFSNITIENNGIIITDSSLQFNSPTLEIKRNLETFLIRSVIAMRRCYKIAEIVNQTKIKGPKEMFRQLLKIDGVANNIEPLQAWSKQINDLRNKIEHEDLKLTDAYVLLSDDNTPKMIYPKIQDLNVDILDFMKNAINNTLLFCEDISMLLISQHILDEVRIAYIPEELQCDHNGYRYKITFSQHLHSKLIEALNKK